MGQPAGPLDPRHRRYRLDRLFVLLYRPRRRASAQPPPGQAGKGRGLAGAWWGLLQYPEVFGRAGVHAGAPDMVQMGSVRDLDLRLRAAGVDVLPEPDRLSDRQLGDEY